MLSMALCTDPRYLSRGAQSVSAGYYVDAVHQHGDPPGVWWGNGAASLELAQGDEVNGEVMEALYSDFTDPRDPEQRLCKAPPRYKTAEEWYETLLARSPNASPEELDGMWADAARRSQRQQAILFADGAYSAFKTYSIAREALVAAALRSRHNGQVAEERRYLRQVQIMDEILLTAAEAGLNYLQDHAGASTRAGKGGKRRIATEGFVVARFHQFDNRLGEPNSHVHQAILARIQGEDGKWRSIDTRALLLARPGASAVADRVLMEEAARWLGLEFRQRADGNGWEIVGVSDTHKSALSTRSAHISVNVERDLAAFVEAYGRQPTALELWQISEQATLDTRPHKQKKLPSVEQRIAAWDRACAAHGASPLADLPELFLGRMSQGTSPQAVVYDWESAAEEIDTVIRTAVARVQRTKSVFTRHDVLRRLSDELPPFLGALPPTQVRRLLEELTDRALEVTSPAGIRKLEAEEVVPAPPELRDAQGRSVYQHHHAGLEKYVTVAELDDQQRLIEQALATGAPTVPFVAPAWARPNLEWAAGALPTPSVTVSPAPTDGVEGAGRTPSWPSAAAPSPLQQRLLDIHTEAVAYYRARLLGDEGAQARDYLSGRGFGEDITDETWQIGYAPGTRYGLFAHLSRQGYTTQELVDSGLVIIGEGGVPQDRFKHRLMFPWRDEQGRVVAFTARKAPGAHPKAPKYLNNKNTAIYDKGAVLFGLSEQRDLLQQGVRPVVAEGPLDVLAARRAGVAAVATCGTSFTAQHRALLEATADPGQGLLMAFDGDEAGLKAAARAYGKLADSPHPVHMLRLDKGTDLGDLAEDPDRLRALAQQNRDLLLGAAIDITAGLKDLEDSGSLRHVEPTVSLVQRAVDLIDPDHPLAATQLAYVRQTLTGRLLWDDGKPREARHVDGMVAFEVARRGPSWEHLLTHDPVTGQEMAPLTPAPILAPRSHLPQTSEQDLAAAQMLSRVLEFQPELRLEQAEAIAGVCVSGRATDMIVGAAGTGKSYTVEALARFWRTHTHTPATGLTLGQNAANVLVENGLDDAHNIARWLRGIHEGEITLTPGQLLVVDEYSMVPNHVLAAIQTIANRNNVKVLWTGDHEQLPSPEAGGMGRYLSTLAGAFELTDPMRFTAVWERNASLQLRVGDEAALNLYDRHGRLAAGSREEMEEAALNGYLADHLSGHPSLLLADTNEAASRLSARARERLIALGKVSTGRRVDLRDGNRASTGDLVVARANDTRIRFGAVERALSNRDTLHVLEVERDGSLTVALEGDHAGVATLSRDYVTQHIELAYSGTAHAAQGRTVGTCHSVVDPSITRQMMYVMLTRGWKANYAYGVVPPQAGLDLRSTQEQAAEETELRRRQGFADRYPTHATRHLMGHQHQVSREEQRLREERIGLFARILDNTRIDQTALEAMVESEELPHHLAHLGGMWLDSERLFLGTSVIDDARLRGALTSEQAARARDSEGVDALGTLVSHLHQAGVDAEALLDEVAAERELDSADSIPQVLYWRIRSAAYRRGVDVDTLEPGEERIHGSQLMRTRTLWVPNVDEFRMRLAMEMDRRRNELAERSAMSPPAWLLDRLGPVPDPAETEARTQWLRAAGIVMGYREQWMSEVPTAEEGIGPMPPRGEPERRANWLQAHDALGGGELDRDMRSLSLGELHEVRNVYVRELAWAPPYVAHALHSASAQAHRARVEADLVAARAQAITDPGQRDELVEEAHGRDRIALSLEEYCTTLDEAQTERTHWHEQTQDARVQALRADAELRRRARADETAGRPPQVDAQALPSLDPDEHRDPASVGQLPDGGVDAARVRAAGQAYRLHAGPAVDTGSVRSRGREVDEELLERQINARKALEERTRTASSKYPEAEADTDMGLDTPSSEPELGL